MSTPIKACYNGKKRGNNMKAIYESKYLQLGLKIAYYRKLNGFTQEQLAEKIDRTPAFIGHVEAPIINKAISLDTLCDIASVLNVPAYKFLMFEEDLSQTPFLD